jgi:hypothetical protein
MRSMIRVFFVPLFALVAACAGPPGPAGEAGEPGADGEDGVDGDPAERVVHVATFTGGQDDTAGPVTGRVLNFEKLRDDTAIRVAYNDLVSAYVEGQPCVCIWQLEFNGRTCADPGNISAALVANVQNIESLNLEGWCSVLPAGPVALTVRAGATAPECQCVTGYFTDGTGFLEAEEIAIAND